MTATATSRNYRGKVCAALFASVAALLVSRAAEATPIREGLVGWFDASSVHSAVEFQPAASSSGWWWEQWEGRDPFLKSGAPDRRGPLALPGIWNQPRGTAFVTDGEEPDLFVRVTGFPGLGLYVYPFSGRTGEGVPVFGTPRPVQLDVTHPIGSSGSIYQAEQGEIRAVWMEGRNLAFGVFSSATRSFSKAGSVEIAGLPRTPARVAVEEMPDGSLRAFFEMSDGVASQPSGAGRWDEDYQPYDGAGIWRGGMPYRYLYGATLPGFGEGPASAVRRLSPSEAEVRLNLNQLAPVNIGSTTGLMTGSHYGGIYFFAGDYDAAELDSGKEIAGTSGNLLRHPTIGPAVIVYPDPAGRADLIVGGEGGLYFYRFTGTFTEEGRPVYEEPTPVLQENADLYAGSLPVVSVADWNGNGKLDLVAGNSEGRVLFFENVGSDTYPSFLPGEAIEAGGREIRIQAGYRGSLQGVGEARWGYAAPTVADWTGNGLPDLIMGDITGSFTVYINKGTLGEPLLNRGRPLYVDGLNLHGMWRVQPAVGRLGDRNALVIADADDHFHLYWQIDDYNVESGGKLRLDDGSLISMSGGFSGHTGRGKLTFADWDQDGMLDLIIGTASPNSIPNQTTGMPKPALPRQSGAVLFMKNVGTNAQPVFLHPAPLRYKNEILYPGGGHAVTAAATLLGGGDGQLNLLVGNQAGRFILLRREHLSH